VGIDSGIFSGDAQFRERLRGNLDDLERFVAHLKAIGLRVVLTSGSFDLVHLGHVKYLAKAKEFGDVLVVGVDSDEKIRSRKALGRPMVPEAERLEMLAHQRPVDLLYLKKCDDARWALIEAVRPDVLVLTEDHSYDEDDLVALKEFCGDIRVLERQATVTTSERIRQLQMHLVTRLEKELPEIPRETIDRIVRG